MKNTLFTNYCGGLAIGLSLLAATARGDEGGALYTMDNAAGANHVLAFHRGVDGFVTSMGSFATGGAGTGAGLSSQGSILLSKDSRWVFACNAGSSEISVLAVTAQGLTLSDKVDSGGKGPVSLTLRQNLLYAVNAGGGAGDKDSITGFIFANGKLLALPESTRALSADNTGPGQVSFTSDGEALVVTERTTSLIDAFQLGADGLASSHKAFQSAGTTPFGFDVGHDNRLFVSEAGTGSASSYQVSEDGELAVISAAVSTKQAAPCWLIVSRDGRYAYTANAGSGSISGYSINSNGSLVLLNADGRTGVTGDHSHPVDLAQSHDGRFLYNLANGNGTLNAFQVNPDGSLQPLVAVGGIPASAAGLAGH
jgi:6-phosphogluconolactonase (cycloisomerase 2 family)